MELLWDFRIHKIGCRGGFGVVCFFRLAGFQIYRKPADEYLPELTYTRNHCQKKETAHFDFYTCSCTQVPKVHQARINYENSKSIKWCDFSIEALMD